MEKTPPGYFICLLQLWLVLYLVAWIAPRQVPPLWITKCDLCIGLAPSLSYPSPTSLGLWLGGAERHPNCISKETEWKLLEVRPVGRARNGHVLAGASKREQNLGTPGVWGNDENYLFATLADY